MDFCNLISDVPVHHERKTSVITTKKFNVSLQLYKPGALPVGS